MHKTQGFLIEGVFSEMTQLGAQDTGTRPTDRITMRGADAKTERLIAAPSGAPKTDVYLPNVPHLLDNRQTGDVPQDPEVWIWGRNTDFLD